VPSGTSSGAQVSSIHVTQGGGASAKRRSKTTAVAPARAAGTVASAASTSPSGSPTRAGRSNTVTVPTRRTRGRAGLGAGVDAARGATRVTGSPKAWSMTSTAAAKSSSEVAAMTLGIAARSGRSQSIGCVPMAGCR
jgi:hypothetical protein